MVLMSWQVDIYLATCEYSMTLILAVPITNIYLLIKFDIDEASFFDQDIDFSHQNPAFGQTFTISKRILFTLFVRLPGF